MAELYGYAVDEERAVATVRAAFDSPVNFLDTSNGYGEDGTAERRIGAAIRRAGGLPPHVVLATKVDPDPRTGDFSGDRVRASLEESMERLGVDRIALLHLHDPERITFEEGVAPGGPVRALVDLRERGLVQHLGVAGGPVGLLQQYLDTGEFEVVLSHNRYTLLDRSAEPLFRLAADRGLGVLNAAPYGGGMLSKGPGVQQKYAYGSRDDRIRTAAEAMEAACRRHEVPLAAAALQFSMRAEMISSHRRRGVIAAADRPDPRAGRRGDPRRALVRARAGCSPARALAGLRKLARSGRSVQRSRTPAAA